MVKQSEEVGERSRVVEVVTGARVEGKVVGVFELKEVEKEGENQYHCR